MATENNVSTVAGDDDAKYGFQRPEMFSSNLAGTVDAYDRHVFLCYKSPESWAPRVENSDVDPLPKLLSSAVKARKNDITVKTKITICEGRDGTLFSDGDVLIFPEMIKYRGLEDSSVDSFVEDVLVNGKEWASGEQEVLTGSHVFVCAHGSRDKRCGVCGPVLIDKLREEINLRGMNDQVFVSPCSHIGGHKYAGNLIIYSPSSDGKIMGHWYGYVTPDDVPEVLDQHIGKGEIIERLWRGQLGASVDESQNVNEKNLPNGDAEKSKPIAVTSCCQGVNGVSCCKDGSAEQNGINGEKKCVGKLSSWMGKWEQNDILVAAAVVGAVTTVAMAYSFYRRSG